MATFAYYIKPSDKRNDGTWNVKIRVTHKRVARLLSTPFYVTKDQITRSYKIKDVALLDKLEEKIKEYRAFVVNIGFGIDDMDVDSLIHMLKRKDSSLDFFEYAYGYIEKLKKSGRERTACIYANAIHSIHHYNNNKPLLFSDFTSRYINGYFNSIQSLKPNSIRAYMICIKKIYKSAQLQYNDEDCDIIVVKHNVFKNIELPKMDSGDRLSLTIEQMQAVIDVPYCGVKTFDFAKDMFVLSFVCFGSNPQDLFYAKKDQYQNDIFTYRRQKVKNRLGKESEMQIKMSDAGKKIIEKYGGDKEYLIDFCGLERTNEICRYIHDTFQRAGLEECNGYKSKVGHVKGKYVFYTARHTMASLARNECGIDYMTVHEMLNHATPRAFKTTDVYIKRDFSRLWDANEKLLSLFDWSFYLNQ